MQPGEFVKRHKVLAASLGTVVYLGLTGYVVPALDTGQWNPRKQWEMAAKHSRLYGEVQAHAEKNNERCCDGDEIGNILKKRGYNRLSDSFNPATEELTLALKLYQIK